MQRNGKRKSGNYTCQTVGKERPVSLEVPMKKALQSHDLAFGVRENQSC